MTGSDQKICPTCRSMHPASQPTCPTDGSMLVYSLLEEPSFVGRVVDGRYRVDSLLAEGGMGRVYLAHQLSVDRRVALKVLRRAIASDVSAVQRFQNEARAASRLTSPHTVTVHDFGQDASGLLFLAMELVEGRSLHRALRDDGPFTPERAVRIVCQILSSLAEAHGQGIVHRDIKPDNVLLTTTPTGEEWAKVTDFGIAKVVSGADVATLTASGTVVGTPRYVSPEQVRGEALDARSDLYSVAVVLYELLAGAPPFDDATPMSLLVRHMQDAPPLLQERAPQVPDALAHVVHWALEKGREARPQTARELYDALSVSLSDAGVPARSTGALPGALLETAAAPSPMRGTAVSELAETGFAATPAPAATPTPSHVAPYDPALLETGFAPTPAPTSDAAPAPAPAPASRPIRWRTLSAFALGAGVAVAIVLAVGPGSDESSKQSAPSAATPAPVQAPFVELAAAPDAAVEAEDVTEDVAVPFGDAGVGIVASAVVPDARGVAADVRADVPAAVRVVRIVSEPDGAEVFEGEQHLGTAPLPVDLAGDDERVVVVRLAGHEDQERTIGAASPDEVLVRLPKKARPATAKVQGKTTGKRPKPDKQEPERIKVPYID